MNERSVKAVNGHSPGDNRRGGLNDRQKNHRADKSGSFRNDPRKGIRKDMQSGSRKKVPEVEGMPSRRMALKVIRRVTEDGAYASLALDDAMRGSGLSGADRRLAARLVYDTLDHMLYLDHVLSQVMAREDTDIRLRNILRLGVCQILIEDRIPESAATNTSVQLCTELGMEGLKGVCNGILRNLIRRKEELVFPDEAAEPDHYASLKYSVPIWLWKRLRDDWGDSAGAMISYREDDNGITVRPNLCRLDGDGFEKILSRKTWGRTKLDICNAWKITGAMDIAEDRDYLSGCFSIQSESSMMAALSMEAERGQQILDCCAAPGGKACLMAEMMNGTGRVYAWDLHEHRVDLINAQARRLGLENIRAVARDARKLKEEYLNSMNGVLLDAPCSGLGVMADKPDIKLHLTEEKLSDLISLQAELLDAVCGYVKPGGRLVYSTCSILKDENERQIEQFLARHPDFVPEKLPETIPEKYRIYEGIGLQLLPDRDHIDGFYICRMQKKRHYD